MLWLKNLLQNYSSGFIKLLFLSVIVVLITSCSQKVYILDGLSQEAANNAVLILGQNSISATKVAEKGNVYKISVKKTEQVKALSILKFNGLPKMPYQNLGEIFKKDSFISSPTEEQSRFIYALEQQISQMIMQINGVVSVETQVSLPPPSDNLWQSAPVRPAAAVLIKYQNPYHLSLYTNRIKELVANSVPGLTNDKVEVVFVIDDAND